VRPYLEKKPSQKRADGVGIGSEFQPQYFKENQKRNMASSNLFQPFSSTTGKGIKLSIYIFHFTCFIKVTLLECLTEQCFVGNRCMVLKSIHASINNFLKYISNFEFSFNAVTNEFYEIKCK
jgi:hypothetical protein